MLPIDEDPVMLKLDEAYAGFGVILSLPQLVNLFPETAESDLHEMAEAWLNEKGQRAVMRKLDEARKQLHIVLSPEQLAPLFLGIPQDKLDEMTEVWLRNRGLRDYRGCAKKRRDAVYPTTAEDTPAMIALRELVGKEPTANQQRKA
jgi:hypothetical protein